jgi:hypothetical protein
MGMETPSLSVIKRALSARAAPHRLVRRAPATEAALFSFLGGQEVYWLTQAQSPASSKRSKIESDAEPHDEQASHCEF